MKNEGKNPKPAKPKKEIPFAFVLEELAPLMPYTKPMFGCTAVYSGEKILFILRKREKPLSDDGIWIATTPEHYASLKKDLPSIRSIEIFGPGPTGWQNIPAQSVQFEEDALRAVALALKKDPRIGKVPAGKKPKKTKPRS
ncbi:MAG: hypothetical protein ACXVBL_19320 [Bdellovibrionota bacterium]